MADVSPETIRDISVKAVEDFLNNKVPLSQGLAKQAAAFDLNSEQVKRAVESTNNIAYLKILQLSDDRTVEFPLAKYAEVMAEATVPEGFQEKTAASKSEINTPINDVQPVASTYEIEKNDAFVWFTKTAAANKQALEDLEWRSMAAAEDLIKSAKTLAKDPAWMDKLACVTTEEEFTQLSYLVSGSVQKYRNLKEIGLFKEAQLKDSGKFVGLFKQAQALVKEQRERLELQKKADDATSSMRKGFMDKAVNAAQKVMEAPGHVVGRGIGSVASIPFNAASSAAKSVKNSLKSNFGKAVGEGSGKTMGAAKAVGATTGTLGKGLFNAANPVMDAALYDPGVDSSTGKSNDAWTALQRE